MAKPTAEPAHSQTVGPPPPWRKTVRSILAVVCGYVAFAVIEAVLYALLFCYHNLDSGHIDIGQVSQVLISLPAAFAAGYITAAIAPSHIPRHATILLASIIIVRIVGFLYPIDLHGPLADIWTFLLTIILIALFVAQGAQVRRKRQAKKEAGKQSRPPAV